MVMTTNDDIFFTPYEIAEYTSDAMAKGFFVAKYMNRQQINTDTVVTYLRPEEKVGSLISAKDKTIRPISEGTELTEIRGVERIGKTKTLSRRGYKLVVTDEELESNAFSLQDNLNDMSYNLAYEMEKNCVNTLKAEAKAPQATGLKGKWSDDTTTITSIESDIIDMQSAYDETDMVGDLNCFFYGTNYYNVLRKNLNREQYQWTIEDEKGYDAYNSGAINALGAFHHKTKFLDDGEALGWNMNNVPATIYYKTNPTLSSASFYDGLPEYAPFVQTYVRRTEGIVPKTEIEMAVSYAITVNKPASLLYQTGL